MNVIDDISVSDDDLIECIDTQNDECTDTASFLKEQGFFILSDFYTNILRLCKCRFNTPCKITESILKMKGHKGIFLRKLMENIMMEEIYERKQSNKRLGCIFINQTENILEIVPVKQTDECNAFDASDNAFVNIYDEKVLVTTAEIISRTDSLKLRLNHYYNFKLKNIYIEEKSNNLMLKSMWYSLLFIATKSHLLHDAAVSSFEERKNTVGAYKGTELGAIDLSVKPPSSSDDNTAVSRHINRITNIHGAISSSQDQSLSVGSSMNIPHMYMDEFLSLNDGQKIALEKCLTTKEFCSIHGMPGTGKSKVIALLIKILLFHGRSVLLVCYTNLSIFNVLKRLNYSYYRAGSFKQERINSKSREDNVFTDKKVHKSVKEWKEYFEQSFVVSTCYNFKDPVFKERTFDYLIIDEASQQHLLLSLIPISISRKFVLVGDPLQLYPLAKSFRGISLLEFLGITCVLNKQYRMKRSIMQISNEMFYEGRMETDLEGDGEVELIDITDHNCKEIAMKNCMKDRTYVNQENRFTDGFFADFLKKLNGSCGKSMLLKNIEKIAQIIHERYDENTTILCYFNVTVEIVRRIDNRYKVSTIDKYQGCESDNVILLIYPFVNNAIMNSRERLNVALTRSRNRLIIICEENEMKNVELFAALLLTINKIK
ncbi:DNA replication helicase [Trachipleistophora hominis]|uniref:DNA replication helicase n=1 Tax=Trachipleistophora hominis TaxID=72359 RepID=L7JU65_TRAHO|nr:DNA replication helicase [Trachipleistophora hominis]